MKKPILFLFLLLLMASSTATCDVMIISNKSVPNSSFSRQDIKDIFFGKKLYWDDKTKITIATLNQGDITESFLKTYLNQNSKQYDSYWEKKIFTGDKNAPIRFKTSKQMLDYITNTKGAIGFIDAKTPTQYVKIITVDEK